MASAMRKSKKVKASKSTSAVDIDKTDPAEFMFKAWVRGEAQSHLSAYVADKDPLHIIRAYQFLRMHKVAPDDTMLRNLDQAHKLIIGASMKDTGAAGIKPKSTPKPTPRNTKRNVDVLRHVHAAYGERIHRWCSEGLSYERGQCKNDRQPSKGTVKGSPAPLPRRNL